VDSDDTLRPAEALDSDEVDNDDGDEPVDPPEDWAAADQIAEEPDGESLDEKLAAEEPDVYSVAACSTINARASTATFAPAATGLASSAVVSAV